MATINVADLQPAVDIEQASRHLELLHGGAPGYLSLVLLGAEISRGRSAERHAFTYCDDIWPAVDDPYKQSRALEDLQDVVNQRWNVYTACSTFGTPPEKGRGTRADICSVPGVWADLDVKPGTEGYFQDVSELQSYVACLPTPTLQVASGSGGLHAYWLTHERLDPVEGERLLKKWLDFLRAESYGHVIENVMDTTRILRLAGTVRWPKRGGEDIVEPRLVSIAREGPLYPTAELELLAESAHEQANSLRNEIKQRRSAAEMQRRESLESRGLPLDVYDHAVRMFNAEQDWGVLLERTGWTLFTDQREGPARCRYWTRPGKSTSDGKSASTDFTSEAGITSNVMTLYSQDPSLIDLWENAGSSDATGICTKYSYTLKRLFEGNEPLLLQEIVRGNGGLIE